MERADGHWGYRSPAVALVLADWLLLADWLGPLLLQQPAPLEMGAPGALAGPCPLFIIYMTCPVSSTLYYSYMAAAM